MVVAAAPAWAVRTALHAVAVLDAARNGKGIGLYARARPQIAQPRSAARMSAAKDDTGAHAIGDTRGRLTVETAVGGAFALRPCDSHLLAPARCSPAARATIRPNIPQ